MSKLYSQEQLKEIAAIAALEETKEIFKAQQAISNDPFILGVGTGTTVTHFIKQLGTWIKQQNIHHSRIKFISSSKQSSELLQKFNINASSSKGSSIDLYIDGADEATKSNQKIQLIKGGGGALTGEKILTKKAKQFICIIDQSKWVKTLGAFPLPLEITKMAYEQSDIGIELVKLGAQPTLRINPATKTPFITEHGNYIYDVSFNKILDPELLYKQLTQIADAHILTNGLFIDKCAPSLVIIAKNNGLIDKVN